MRREFKPLSADGVVMNAVYGVENNRKRGYDAVECHMEGPFRITKFKTPWTCEDLPVFVTTTFDTKCRSKPSTITLTAESDAGDIINITEAVKDLAVFVRNIGNKIMYWDDISLVMVDVDGKARNLPYVQTRKEFYHFNSPYYQADMDTRDYQCYLKWVKREIDCGYGYCFLGKVHDAESFSEFYAENSFEQPVGVIDGIRYWNKPAK